MVVKHVINKVATPRQIRKLLGIPKSITTANERLLRSIDARDRRQAELQTRITVKARRKRVKPPVA